MTVIGAAVVASVAVGVGVAGVGDNMVIKDTRKEFTTVASTHLESRFYL